jgi:hypothetical protein
MILRHRLGWERTIDKLVEYLKSEKTSGKYAQGLEDVYIDLTNNGNKLVRVYNLLGEYDEIVKFFKLIFLKKILCMMIGFRCLWNTTTWLMRRLT